MADATTYLEIGPLKERNYTGISQVTASIAEQMLGDSFRSNAFFFGRSLVDPQVIEDVLARRNGEMLEWHLRRVDFKAAPRRLSARNVAIFPNRKTCRRAFEVECQIIHDLSTLLTPQFHNADTIAFHATTMLEDVATNNLTFCVSEATRQDVLRYLGPLDPKSVVTIPLGVNVEADIMVDLTDRKVERYAVVLGTIEPRKNIEIVLDYIRRNRSVLRNMRFVFLGRFGWGESVDALVRRHDLGAEHEARSILFPGFVSENTKNALIRNAQVLIYPSLFEGFGIPVAEALTLGVPVVTTRSSSIPEVGQDCCYYFDPFTEGTFGRSLSRALVDLNLREEEVRAKCAARAGAFSWREAYRTMTEAIDSKLSTMAE